MTFAPNSGQRRLRAPQIFGLIFRPGVMPAEDYIFSDFMELREYIRRRSGKFFQVEFDLSQIDWTLGFDVPVSTYSMEKIQLMGVINPDGTFPLINLPEGMMINPDDQVLNLFQINIRCRNTSTPIITPTTRYRVNQDLATIISDGSGYFADMSNGGDFVISAVRNSGLRFESGNELVYIPSGGQARIFLEEDAIIDEDMIEAADNTVNIGVFYALRSVFGTQANVPAGVLTKSCLAQSGDTFPAETYPGKLFQKTPENRYYMRNQDDTAWVQLSVPPTVFSNTATAATTNIFVTYVSGVYNFEQVRPHKITVSWLWALTQTSKDFWGQVLIGGTPVGISDGVNTLVLKSQPFKAGAAPTWGQIAPGIYEIEYTPMTTGPQTIDFRFRASDNTATAYVQGATITVQEVL